MYVIIRRNSDGELDAMMSADDLKTACAIQTGLLVGLEDYNMVFLAMEQANPNWFEEFESTMKKWGKDCIGDSDGNKVYVFHLWDEIDGEYR